MFAIMIGTGAAAGWLCLLLSRKLIESRTKEPIEKFLITGKYAPVFWCLLGATGFTLIRMFNSDVLKITEFSLIFLICISISAVDITIKKIPNSLLLALIIIRTASIALNYSSDELTGSIIGFVAASIIFTLPSLLRIRVGAGDMKLAAITGLYLGLYGFLQEMIIMALGITLYGAYLAIKKIGNFKTQTAMGPYIAFGLFCTVLFPVI